MQDDLSGAMHHASLTGICWGLTGADQNSRHALKVRLPCKALMMHPMTTTQNQMMMTLTQAQMPAAGGSRPSVARMSLYFKPHL